MSVPMGFRRSHIVILLMVFLLGALTLWYSLATHPQVQSHFDVLNTQQPMNVLVGVQGTPLNPGFLGFIAVVHPKSNVLTVIPISGLIPVTVNHRQESLYQAISDTTPARAARLASQASGIPIDHYFYLNSYDLTLLLDTLYNHSPNWPNQLSPLTMLQTLGYPYGRTVPKQEMKLVSMMVNRLASINPLAASSLLAIPRTAKTNLPYYELYLLADYVRGDKLQPVSPRQYAHHLRRVHG